MTKNKPGFTQKEWIILIIMSLLIIILLSVDIFLLFQNSDNEVYIAPLIATTSKPMMTGTPTQISTISPQFTQPAPTNQLKTAVPRLSTSTNDLDDQTPSSYPTVSSTTTATPPPRFFTNEWDGKTNQWKWFSTIGNDNLWDVYNEAGVLVFSLLGKDTNGYFIYDPWEYNNVEVTTQIEVRSLTKSSTSILCNYSEENGWYEFNISSNGLWELRAHDSFGRTGYVSLSSGGSLAIQTGEGINEYTAICEGNHLTYFINGTQVLDFTDKLLKFQRGKIGIGVFSYSEVPVLVESAWVKISQP